MARKQQKPKRVPVKERLQHAWETGRMVGYNAGCAEMDALLKQSQEGRNVEQTAGVERRKLIEQALRSFAALVDAAAHVVTAVAR